VLGVLQYSAVQCCTARQHSTVQYSAIHYFTARQYSAVQCRAAAGGWHYVVSSRELVTKGLKTFITADSSAEFVVVSLLLQLLML